MSLFWTVLGKPLAMLGGRSFEEMAGRRAGECDKSVLVGLMCLVSIGIVFAGQWLFWRNVAHVGDAALWVAAAIAALFLVMYRVLLRAMETMGRVKKVLLLAPLAVLMGVTALVAGHELPLLAFKPQVEEQARLGAARGVTAYAGAVETSLGLPQLRQDSGELGRAVAAAQTERSRIPELVTKLQQQAQACDKEAKHLHASIPADTNASGWADAHKGWLNKHNACGKLSRQAGAELAHHQARVDEQLLGLKQSLSKTRKALDEATTRHEDTLQRDTPTLTASATTGFARHTALWAAVAAGTVPAWAAYGLMVAVLVIDALSFLLKLLMPDDTAGTDRIQSAGTDAIYNILHAGMVRQQQRLARRAVKSMQTENLRDLQYMARQVVGAAVAQGVDERAFKSAAAAQDRMRQAGAAPEPAMVGRLGKLADLAQQRRARARAGQGEAA